MISNSIEDEQFGSRKMRAAVEGLTVFILGLAVVGCGVTIAYNYISEKLERRKAKIK